MKKLMIVFLILSICVSLCACGDLEGKTLTYMSNCTARFSNGTLYLNVFGDHQTYDYRLEDNNTIVINNVLTYTYEIDGSTVTFDGDFMGVSDVWWK